MIHQNPEDRFKPRAFYDFGDGPTSPPQVREQENCVLVTAEGVPEAVAALFKHLEGTGKEPLSIGGVSHNGALTIFACVVLRRGIV